jgi:hypothetical protein
MELPTTRVGAVAFLLALGATQGGGPAAATTDPRAQPADPARRDWIQLFDGRSLDGWLAKFRHQDLGVNLRETFRVEDGLLKVRYDNWAGFDDEFGHLFYREPFSYYVLAAEYRFVGGQVGTARTDLGWAIRNNGLMLHAQDPKTMLRDQDFPVSLEVQLLGGLGDGRSRPTANLCTPGTHVVLNGRLHTAHCTTSSARTYDGDQWVRVEVVVHGGEIVKHVVEGQTVLEYTKPQIGGGAAQPTDPAVKVDGTLLSSGFIALQAETAPIDFRKVELLNLEGCTDPKASNYKTYLVKAKPSTCVYD